MATLFAFMTGLLLGAGIAGLVAYIRYAQARREWNALAEGKREEDARQWSEAVDRLQTTFAALSRDALSANSAEFLKLATLRFDQQSREASGTLENKKALIDAGMEEVTRKLTRLSEQLHAFDTGQREVQGVLKGHVEQATRATNRLQETTNRLHDALANPKRRGQWGERMADDVLRLAGFEENVNYVRQQKLENRRVPDFTFPLPSGRVIHMDVKFPLDNYLRVLDANDDAGRQAATQQFLRDVRNTIKDVTRRDYVDPGAGTVDYVLVFIPNEQVFSFLHESDATVMDEALKQKVVLCAPLSLYAILSVVRQATENFYLEQATRQILELLADFKKQWAAYLKTMDKMGKNLEGTLEQYRELIGTRKRMLDRQFRKIESLESNQTETPPPPAKTVDPQSV